MKNFTKKLFKTFILLTVISISFTSCSEESTENLAQEKLTKKQIQNYFDSKGIDYKFIIKNTNQNTNQISINSIEELDALFNSINKNLNAKGEVFTHEGDEGISGGGGGGCVSGGFFTHTSRAAGTLLNPIYLNVTYIVEQCAPDGASSFITGSTTGYTYNEIKSYAYHKTLSTGKLEVHYGAIGTIELALNTPAGYITSTQAVSAYGTRTFCCTN